MSGQRSTSLGRRGVRYARRGGVITASSILAILLFSPSVWACTPSDNRSTFHSGNITRCSDLNLGSDTLLASGDSSASDANLSGTVGGNSGSIQSGTGQELSLAITGQNIVIDAVVVEVSDNGGYNVYSDQSVLPPSLQPDQHYIPPFIDGHVPNIGHWFTCYRTTGSGLPTGAGTLGLVGGTGVLGVVFAGVIWRSRRRRAAVAAS